MNTYKRKVLLEVEVQAFSDADADEAISDLFGAEETEAFDVTVTNMEIVR
jgi:hypothetical protein